jgi:hypothetical protein
MKQARIFFYLKGEKNIRVRSSIDWHRWIKMPKSQWTSCKLIWVIKKRSSLERSFETEETARTTWKAIGMTVGDIKRYALWAIRLM